ncbi:hypothetical protein DFH08DRAFT_1071872 [Mycena albidolilacea]|uniref:Uncharacterized protein n=1 Tax=Mycena albidolilacea TaxID=1033008 RepID=A0AAD7ARB0_9AGAR|nr:hypothetical protein DFH08DRAFT_1071872 [Mycena albidolilacea]
MTSLLLLSLHLLAPNCMALGHPLRCPEEPIPSDPDIDDRTLFNIISGCLATGKLALAGPRFCLMLVAVITPEFMAGFATRQVLSARWFSKRYDVSLTHGFLFAMGGFDKSKGDSLSKGVVLLQGLWFTTQCLARVQQHLPLTGLEVATLAFQSVNIFIWLLWWHKLFDVEQPILIGSASEFFAWTEQRHRSRRVPVWVKVTSASNAIVWGYYPDFDTLAYTSVPSFWSARCPDQGDLHFLPMFIFVQVLVGTIFGTVHCAAWNALSPSTGELFIWRSCSLVIAAAPSGVTLLFILTLLGEKIFDTYTSGKTAVVAANRVFAIIATAAYITAHLVLVALSLTTLRALPPGVFVDVNWSTYIPHF